MNRNEEMLEYRMIAANNILFYDEIDSTNIEAKKLVREGKFDEGVIIAEFQTAGRGTQGRNWVSKGGTSILMTMVTKTDKQLEEVQGITVTIGEIVHKVIKEYLKDKEVTIKLPNDILVNGKKICGILTESIKYNEELYLVIGIGINVNTEVFPEIERGVIPTSFYLESGEVFSRKEIVERLIATLSLRGTKQSQG